LNQFLLFEANYQSLFLVQIKPAAIKCPPLMVHLIFSVVYCITAENNTVLTYRDMTHTNTYGPIHDHLQFFTFVFQYYSLVLDLLILGLQQANKMASLPQMPNNFLQYCDSATETCHPIWLYSHYVDQLHILFHFTADKACDLI
ncbi:RNA recognition motif of the spliceosomal PrP8-domain-containing protein, partial [Scleroderma yunnanense]